jgi:tight adherence protein C
VLGAALAGVAAAALVLAARRPSTIGRRLDLLAPRTERHSARWRPIRELDLRHAGVRHGADRIVAVKIACGLASALVAVLFSLVLPIGPALVLAAAYVGSVAPSMWLERRARLRRGDADRAVSILVERMDALVSAGRPPETALVLLMAQPSTSPLLDATLRRAAEAYSLGAPIFRTLAAQAREDGIPGCAAFADEMERGRDLGAGSLVAIRERRNALRAAERARSIEAAAQVEGKLMLVLVLCYLPALILLVVVPLFIGLLEGLFA